MNSVFDLFSIGVGPSSSHTVGPMKAACDFVRALDLEKVASITVHLYGSLALTGRGHSTDKAVVLGLMGNLPDTVDLAVSDSILDRLSDTKELILNGERVIAFDLDSHILWHRQFRKLEHANTMSLEAFGDDGELIVKETFFSIGGGFVLKEGEILQVKETVPYPFMSADELLDLCSEQTMSIAQIMLANECVLRDKAVIESEINAIWQVMVDCMVRGLATDGILPGGLNVHRRAKDLKMQIESKPTNIATIGMEWLSIFAIAINEENAAGGRVVTAPTNGAAGIVPSVLHFYEMFEQPFDTSELITFFMTAAAIGHLFKTNASISGAEMGCQGEVGVASAMAAAGLTALRGGSPEQIECAAEIAMEHHLGLTCDPIKGLVQIPCIERNSMGAVKAVTACELAMKRTLGHRKITLDKVIKTMKKTGEDMKSSYKETSQGGLAVYGVEC